MVKTTRSSATDDTVNLAFAAHRRQRLTLKAFGELDE